MNKNCSVDSYLIDLAFDRFVPFRKYNNQCIVTPHNAYKNNDQ